MRVKFVNLFYEDFYVFNKFIHRNVIQGLENDLSPEAG